jgi:hypothetical protein
MATAMKAPSPGLILDRMGSAVATVSKRWFSMRETYAVDVAAGQDDLLILAGVLALDLRHSCLSQTTTAWRDLRRGSSLGGKSDDRRRGRDRMPIL